MRNPAFALAALALSAVSAPAAAGQDVAPAATRVPSRASGPAACGPTPAAPCASAGSAQRYRSALEAVRPAGDVELNNGITKVMGDLMAAGRCGDAVSLARRDGRSELAARAEQLCK
jgi:hypothetical protein